MTERIKPPEGSVFQRWSRLKTEAREKGKAHPSTQVASAPPDAAEPDSANGMATLRTQSPASPAPSASGSLHSESAAAGSDSLPPIESLTLDSDFAPFLKPKVDEALKRRALKQLFRDPHFNVMDDLDVYIDDYSKPDPIAPEIVRQMVQARYIFDPPATRVNAQGHVEDVPPEELAALEADEEVPPEELAALKHEEVPLEKLAALKPDAQDVPPEGATAADIGDKGAAPQ